MNNQNYGVIGNCRTSTLVSQTEALSFIFGNYIQSYSLKPLKGCKFSN